MSITQKQIADVLGVSQMTVSYALRGSQLVADDTRQRVLKAARELGYRPNTSARAIKSGRFNHVALVVSPQSYKSYLPAPLITGVHDTLAERNAHMTLAAAGDEELSNSDHLPKVVREWSVDGLLINYIQEIPALMAEVIERHRIPSVWLNTKQPHDCVYPNDHEASRGVAERLLGLGHRRIMYVSLGPSPHYSYGDRRDGCVEAVEEAGLTADVMEISRKARGDDDLTSTLQRRLRRADRPSAIVTYCHEEAWAAMVAARLAGLVVPQDLSVVCFAAEHFDALGRRVSHSRIPFQQVGKSAVQMLMERIDRRDQVADALALPHRLDEGETMGPAAS